MRLTRKYILALAFVSFLTITMSGFHLHADIGGHDATASHEHDLHHTISHDPEHQGEYVDVSVFEPARGFSKLDVVAPAPAVPELTAAVIVEICGSRDAPDTAPTRYLRVRPPLRAPPVSA